MSTTLSTHGDNMGYRRDIDSLRAFAIIPVVLFHAGLSFIPGGFVGVDVFFVISGFLISKIIIREVWEEQFSLMKFYERRARRIIPALIAVVSITMIFGWVVFKPEEVNALGKSAAAAIGFSSNIWFWKSALEYFGPAVESAPLLHTWSLAVEEQFYILFPLLILVIYKYTPRHIGKIVLAVTLLSFLLATYMVYLKPSATFYLLPTRAWELGIGSVLAIYSSQIRIGSSPFREIIAILGIALLLYPLFFYSKSMPFPGWTALAPCLGAAMLIALGHGKPVRALSFMQWSPLVFVGKISYSLYLVHWPVAVFTKYLSNTATLTYSMAILVIAISVACAIFSWRFIEQPFRSSTASTYKILGYSGGTMTLVAALAIGIASFDSWKFRLPSEQQAIVDAANDRAETPSNCTPLWMEFGLCPIGAINRETSNYDFILMGDSHALSISTEISDSARLAGKSGLMMNMICPPLSGVFRLIEPRCTDFTEAVLSEVLRRTDVKTVILHARWAYYESGTDIDGKKETEKYNLLLVRDALDKTGSNPHQIFERGFRRTIEQLLDSGRNVIIIEGVPEVGWNVPNALILKERWGIEPPAPPSIEAVRARQSGARSVFDQFRGHPRVHLIDPIPAMCGNYECRVALEGIPAYYDGDHLTKSAAKSLFREIFIKEIYGNMQKPSQEQMTMKQ
ncbi:MAG: acyltransferase [Hydrogenophaga sp.]|jgi:peptidoglycan/LPS O-acetylase OafA/YrhL|uniref:acyltransferase family protein n=1 Tax=Hydrogenophaga sp. TaxID=1904254 RepID=UPI00263508F2|nr:acyltransferase family protein [Hydrogenophaga sp.]MCV0440841.1 acyltransferase [Hydrogenophaga sp.]